MLLHGSVRLAAMALRRGGIDGAVDAVGLALRPGTVENRFLLDPVTPGKGFLALVTMLYRATHCRRRPGACVR